jgi:hypothetical protein
MELALPIAEVLAQPIPIPQQFAQLLGGRVGQPTGRRPLLGGEPRDAQGINGVGLRPLEFFRGKAPRPQGIQQGHRESLGHQYGEYILPVMAGRLHGHQGLWRRPQQREQVLVAPSILGEAGGFEHYRLRRIHTRHDMPLRAHIDPHESHPNPFRREVVGASRPVPLLTLVYARTRAAPQDTVRAWSTGRGRQSESRGPRLKRVTATLSRIPSIPTTRMSTP